MYSFLLSLRPSVSFSLQSPPYQHHIRILHKLRMDIQFVLEVDIEIGGAIST